MPRFKKETFGAQNKAGSKISLDVVINISADGEFYANLPDYLLDAFADQRSWLGGGRKPKDVSGTFKVVEATYERLRQVIDNGLRKHLEPEVTEMPVIRYNIESHVSFAEDENGTIVPNAGFPGAKWINENQKLYGDHHAAKPARNGYSLVIGARAMLKRIIRHGGNERVEYETFYAGGSHHGHDNPAELLNSWCSMGLGDSPKEIPYTEKAALFFHSLLLGMATLNRQIQMATFEQENLLALIEKQSSIGLLGAPAPQKEG